VNLLLPVDGKWPLKQPVISHADSLSLCEIDGLKLSGLGFVTLGPFHCAYCMWARWGGPDGIEA